MTDYWQWIVDNEKKLRRLCARVARRLDLQFITKEDIEDAFAEAVVPRVRRCFELYDSKRKVPLDAYIFRSINKDVSKFFRSINKAKRQEIGVTQKCFVEVEESEQNNELEDSEMALYIIGRMQAKDSELATIMRMRFVDSLTIAEIELRTGLSRGTVHKRVTQALSLAKGSLNGHANQSRG